MGIGVRSGGFPNDLADHLASVEWERVRLRDQEVPAHLGNCDLVTPALTSSGLKSHCRRPQKDKTG